MTARLEGGVARLRAASLRIAAVLALTFAASLLVMSAVARADGLELCAGYSGCSRGAFTTNGYQNAAGQSWWRMYAGINCTNYAAYVESQLYGVPEPALLLGDAYQWAANAASAGIPVNQTPTVGSVAVWAADAPGMGGFGHVAVVEAVGPGASYIDVSQSGMGTATDGFEWEQISRGPAWEPWPSSFIHFQGPAVPGTMPPPGQRVGGAQLTAAGGY
jgi:surface antigen